MQTGTTTEQNLADQMRKRGITYKPVVFEDVNITFATYAEGRCDAVTTDRSALVSRRTTLPKPEDNVILDDVLSSEPLAPAVAKGDTKWSDIVKWTVYALVKAEELGIKPLAKVLAYADAQQAPEWFTTAPAKAIPLALNKAGLKTTDIDLFEINEAFSVVSLANNKELNLDAQKVNVNGGAVSLGHPLGSSGARIVVTLIHALNQNNGKFE